MNIETSRTERLNVRVTPEMDEVLREAAAVEQKTLSAFVLDAAYERARRTLDDHHRIVVTRETFNRLLDELDQPAEVVPALRDLIRGVEARRP